MNYNPNVEGENYIHKTMSEHTRRMAAETWRRERDQNIRDLCAFMIILAAILAMMMVVSCEGRADEIPEEKLLQCVIGESANQGITGMEATCRALMNRGTTKGVYGCNSSMPSTQPEWVWSMARNACENAERRDITNGATHWEAVSKYGKPYWADSMVVTARIKDHTFYKEAK